MRFALIPTVILAGVVSTPLMAQTWSPEQREIIDFADGCWSSWATEDWATYESACPGHPEGRYWDMNESLPSYGHRSWKGWAEAMWPHLDAVHHEIRPIAVQFFGDLALYYFFAAFSNVDTNGQVSTFTRRELAVLQRQGEGWVVVGGSWMTFPG